nr:helix-turn-helix transcriptional regulator [Selenomonadaceae bacterium]
LGDGMTDSDYGRVALRLEEYRVAHGISKNQLVAGANVQRTQLLHYLRGDVARVDLAVLARICWFLGCRLDEIMDYEPPAQNKSRK